MSHHEVSLVIPLFMVLFIMVWKWNKSLQLIISFEVLTMFLIGGVCSISVYSSVFITLLLFFVGEALIMLSSLLGVLRATGFTHSVISLN